MGEGGRYIKIIHHTLIMYNFFFINFHPALLWVEPSPGDTKYEANNNFLSKTELIPQKCGFNYSIDYQ